MTKWHLKSRRKPTGGKLKKDKKKKKYQRGSKFLETKIGKFKKTIKNGFGGNKKLKLISVNKANVRYLDGKIKNIKIISVAKNAANPHYVRRNIITKGAIIKTEDGLAKVTNRPARDGTVNAVLLEEK